MGSYEPGRLVRGGLMGALSVSVVDLMGRKEGGSSQGIKINQAIRRAACPNRARLQRAWETSTCSATATGEAALRSVGARAPLAGRQLSER